MINNRQLRLALSLLLFGFYAGAVANPQTSQASGTDTTLDKQQSTETTTQMADARNESGFDFQEVVRTCNASFTIPLGQFRHQHVIH